MTVTDPFEVAAETFDWIQTFRGDIPFWIYQARRNSGAVLELGCGTGRTTWEIADAGVPIVGLDLSKAMLAIAESKRKLYPNAASVILKQADMRDFNLGIKFKTIIMPGRSFEHALTAADQAAVFAACQRHLHDRGNLILCVMAQPDVSQPQGVEYFHKTVINPNTQNHGRLYLKNEFDSAAQIHTLHQRLEEHDGQNQLLREWHFPPVKKRWFKAEELEKLGQQHQLQVVARFCDWLRRPYQEGDPYLIYIYQK